MEKQQEFPRPEYLERDDDKAKSLQLSTMQSICLMIELLILSVRSMFCRGVGDRTMSIRGRIVLIFRVIRLCRRHNIVLCLRNLLVQYHDCIEHGTDLVIRIHRAGEPLHPDEHYLTQHKPPRK